MTIHYNSPHRLKKWSQEKHLSLSLPPVEKNLLSWILKERPSVAGKPRDFALEPFLVDMLEDMHPYIQYVMARQTYKTTSAADMLGWAATNHKMAEVGYVVDSEPRRIAFSKQRLREQVFLHNPKLRQFLPFERANVGDITLLNGTHIYPANDEGGYKNIEGKSLALLVFDEWQYHDTIEQMPKAMYTLFRTHGLFRGFGIGGEAGSEYHKKWMMTDQREWYYDNQDEYQGWSGQGWRKDLLFDEAGNIINSKSELKSILAGHWRATKPENTEFHGYHISQLLYAVIPLTIKDAVEKYRINPSFSIEWQKKKTHTSTYIAHVLADFYKAERRPITPEMVYACMHPYRHLALLSGQEVLQTKESLGKRIRVLMGVDWGSSVSKPTTVVAIIIKDREFETYRLAWIEKRPAMKEPDQAAYMANLALIYGVDACVGDLGYGETTVPLMQDGGYDTQGNKIPALGRRRMMGCRTIGDETKPEMEYKTKADEHGKQLAHLKIDKTTTIQKFVDFLGWYVEHPEIVDQAKKRPKFIIPFKNDWETDFLVDDFCALTRKDLEKELEIVVEDPRQRARKEFNHPADSMMACIYCMVADENYDEDAYRITGARQRR